MKGASGHGFRRTDSCVDYQSYLVPLDPGVSTSAYFAFRKRILALGTPEPERMGVTYVQGPWGFLAIPQAGFPELRVNFYHDTPIRDRDAVLTSIAVALRVADAPFAPIGEEDE